MIWASAKERGRPAKLAKSGCRNTPLPASFAYGETAAAAVLYSYVPFLLLGFMFQLIARHLLYTPERYSGGKFRNFPPLLSHVCPAALSFDGYADTNSLPKSIPFDGLNVSVKCSGGLKVTRENERIWKQCFVSLFLIEGAHHFPYPYFLCFLR